MLHTRSLVATLALTLCLAGAAPAAAQWGVLDPAFGTGGTVTTNVGTNGNAYANASALQADGRLIVAGGAGGRDSGAIGAAFVLTRQLTDGALDPTFGDGGVVVTVFEAQNAAANALAIQHDGKIIVAGHYWTTGSFSGFALARYLPDGTLDASFGDGGRVTTRFGDSWDEAFAVTVQPDGRIVAAGRSQSGINVQFALARYLPDGSLDPSFSDDGTATTFIFGNQPCGAYTVAVQPGGRIVTAGYSTGTVEGLNFALAGFRTDGTLDPSFSNDGLITMDLTGRDDVAYALATQPDGHLVAAGVAGEDFALARYLPDGQFDSSFDDDGLVTTSFGPYPFKARIRGLAIRPDGRLVAAGYGGIGTAYDFALAQYLPSGALDPSFDGDGKLISDFGTGPSLANALALQSDGKLVAVGFEEQGDDLYDAPVFLSARYFMNGAPDPAFGTGGVVRTTPAHPGTDHATAVALQPDGKIVVAGSAGVGTTSDFALARHLPDGSLDAAFGSEGIARIPLSAADDHAYAVALQADGRIVLAGSTRQNGPEDFAVARVLPDGQLDSSFGDGGFVTTDFTSSGNPSLDYAQAVAVQPDGRIVAVGYTATGGRFDFALARYLPDGSLDVSFSEDGRVTISFSEYDLAFGVALQPDGKILVAGRARVGSSFSDDFALTRHLPDGSLDVSFSEDGRVTTSFASQGDGARAITLQPDGRIVVAGAARISGAGDDFAVARYLPDGSLDPSFDGGGRLTTDFAGGFDIASAVAVQSDGRIVVVGRAETGMDTYSYDFALARYLPSGTLDPEFGDSGRVTTTFGPGADWARGLALQPDGDAVVAGYGRGEVSEDFALARYLTGTPVATSPPPDPQATSLTVTPNPVWAYAAIRYALLSAGPVRLSVYDVLGREVALLQAGPRGAGAHTVDVRAAALPAGVYFVRLRTGEASLTRAFTVVRRLP